MNVLTQETVTYFGTQIPPTMFTYIKTFLASIIFPFVMLALLILIGLLFLADYFTPTEFLFYFFGLLSVCSLTMLYFRDI